LLLTKNIWLKKNKQTKIIIMVIIIFLKSPMFFIFQFIVKTGHGDVNCCLCSFAYFWTISIAFCTQRLIDSWLFNNDNCFSNSHNDGSREMKKITKNWINNYTTKQLKQAYLSIQIHINYNYIIVIRWWTSS